MDGDGAGFEPRLPARAYEFDPHLLRSLFSSAGRQLALAPGPQQTVHLER